jgi:hypothetical protein
MAGFDALFINRIHFSLKSEFKSQVRVCEAMTTLHHTLLRAQRHMEFLWRGADMGVGLNATMFTHVLHTHYSAPKGFDWEEGAMPVSSSNVGMRAQELIRVAHDRLRAYRTRHLLVPFGDDFKFRNAAHQFSQMDQVTSARPLPTDGAIDSRAAAPPPPVVSS